MRLQPTERWFIHMVNVFIPDRAFPEQPDHFIGFPVQGSLVICAAFGRQGLSPAESLVVALRGPAAQEPGFSHEVIIFDGEAAGLTGLRIPEHIDPAAQRRILRLREIHPDQQGSVFQGLLRITELVFRVDRIRSVVCRKIPPHGIQPVFPEEGEHLLRVSVQFSRQELMLKIIPAVMERRSGGRLTESDAGQQQAQGQQQGNDFFYVDSPLHYLMTNPALYFSSIQKYTKSLQTHHTSSWDENPLPSYTPMRLVLPHHLQVKVSSSPL